MCFYIHHDHNDAKTAKRDITCYKVLIKRGQKYEALIFDKFYRIGTKPRPVTLDRWGFGIDRGYHSYSTKRKAKQHCSWSNDIVVVEFIIPKGATYYYNPDYKEYVATQIIPVKEVT